VTKQRASAKRKPALEAASLLDAVIEGMQEIKAHDIVVLDMRNLQNAMADYFVVCHGNSNTQVQAISQSVEKVTKERCGDDPWHVEGVKNGQWILMDYINIVVHVFEKEARYFYGLEDLWADATIKRIE
jgi:ribosome-associated protein